MASIPLRVSSMAPPHACHPVNIRCLRMQHTRLLCPACVPSGSPSLQFITSSGLEPHTCEPTITVRCKTGRHRWLECLNCQPFAGKCHNCRPAVPDLVLRPVYVINRPILPRPVKNMADKLLNRRGESATRPAVAVSQLNEDTPHTQKGNR